MGWFTKEAPALVRFANGKYAIRRKRRFLPYEYLSLVSGEYWYCGKLSVGAYALGDERKARAYLELVCLYHDKGTPV